MKNLLAALLCAALSACTTMGNLLPLSGEAVTAVVAIEAPDMCIRAVETQSDVAVVRPDFQTVIAQSCTRWDGMGDAAVIWVTVTEPPRYADPEQQLTVKTALQKFAAKRAGMGKPSQTLNDLVSLAKEHPNAPIRIIGYADGAKDGPLGLKRAKAVAAWMASKGIDSRRIETVAGSGDKPEDFSTPQGTRAESQIMLIVTGGA